MTRVTRMLVTAMLLACGALVFAQSENGRLAGVVVSGETSSPVAGALVTLTADDQPARSRITDETGRFVFDRLPSARYLATASKAAFVTMSYGATATGGPGTSIAVGAAVAPTDLRFVLPRGGVVTGTIRDLAGAPARGVSVQVVRVDSASRLVATDTSQSIPRNASVTTDDRGVYRAWGLTPGTYVVMVSPPAAPAAPETRILSAREISDVLRDLQARGAAAVSDASPTSAPQTFAPIYYPGTTNLAEATPLVIAAGDERVGVDVTQMLVRAATISGTIVGAPAGSPIPMSATRNDLWPDASIQFREGFLPSADATGAFRFTGVRPGHYVLSAHAGGGGRGIPGPVVDQPQLWARTEFDVNGEDVTGLALSLRPGVVISGRVTFDATRLTAPADLTKVRLALRPASVPSDRAGGDTAVASPRSDGTFTLPGVPPGHYVLSATTPLDGASGWWLASAAAGGIDIGDTPFELTADLPDALVTFADRHTELSGTLQVAGGGRVADYAVVVFPVSPMLRTPPARGVRLVRPATDGRYVVPDLPAGEYFVAPIDAPRGDGWQDPGVLDGIAAAATRITVPEHGRATADLRAGG